MRNRYLWQEVWYSFAASRSLSPSVKGGQHLRTERGGVWADLPQQARHRRRGQAEPGRALRHVVCYGPTRALHTSPKQPFCYCQYPARRLHDIHCFKAPECTAARGLAISNCAAPPQHRAVVVLVKQPVTLACSTTAPAKRLLWLPDACRQLHPTGGSRGHTCTPLPPPALTCVSATVAPAGRGVFASGRAGADGVAPALATPAGA